MNLFDALSASLASEQVTGLPGTQKDSTGLTGVFAQLVGTSGEGNATSPEALLANIEALPSESSLTGQNAAFPLLLPGEPSSELILIDPAATQDNDASLLLQTQGKESGSTDINTDEISILPSVTGEETPELDAQADPSEILPSHIPPASLPVNGAGLANAQSEAASAAGPGLERALAGIGASAGKSDSQPAPGAQPPAPQPGAPQLGANSATPGQSGPGQNGGDEQGRVINPAGLQEQTSQRARQGSSSQTSSETPSAGSSDSPRSETTELRPGSRGTYAVPQPALFKTVINPASGQALLQVQNRTDSDAKGPGGIDSGMSGIQLRATGTGSAMPAQQPAHVPINSLAVHIAQQAKNGARRFDIRLDPPELGRIDVRLDVSRDGQVNTHLVVERAETLELLQRDARALERALQNAGLDTSEGSMKFSLKDEGLAQNSAQGDGNEAGNGNGGDTDNEGDGIIDGQDAPLHPERRYVATSGLDIRI